MYLKLGRKDSLPAISVQTEPCNNDCNTWGYKPLLSFPPHLNRTVSTVGGCSGSGWEITTIISIVSFCRFSVVTHFAQLTCAGAILTLTGLSFY